MGLDMYLYEKEYLSPYSDEDKFNKVAAAVGAMTTDEVENTYDMPHPKPAYLTSEVAYWRKSNQIHTWFVENVQAGVDDCSSYDVSVEQLTELRDLCQKVLERAKVEDGTFKNGWRSYTNDDGERVSEDVMQEGLVIVNIDEIKELLPNSSGFFFGSTEYSEYYLKDLEQTVKMIDAALEGKDQWATFEYRASW